jgi:hypothetical protein
LHEPSAGELRFVTDALDLLTAQPIGLVDPALDLLLDAERYLRKAYATVVLTPRAPRCVVGADEDPVLVHGLAGASTPAYRTTSRPRPPHDIR